MHEEWGYDSTLFIADFGGSLGFLLGVSILSALEIVEGVILSLFRIYQQKKLKKMKEEDKKLEQFQMERQVESVQNVRKRELCNSEEKSTLPEAPTKRKISF